MNFTSKDLKFITQKIQDLAVEASEQGLPNYPILHKIYRAIDNDPNLIFGKPLILQITCLTRKGGLHLDDELFTASLLDESNESNPVVIDNIVYDESVWQWFKEDLLKFCNDNNYEVCPLPLLLLYLAGTEQLSVLIERMKPICSIRIDDILLEDLIASVKSN